jgi:tRNA A-37 threonylcarbamoyl transferase component Bud32
MTDPTIFTPPDDLATLVGTKIQHAPQRAFPIEWRGQKVWVKITAPYNYYGWHRVQKAIARLLVNPMLLPTVSVGGQAGLAYEFERLHELREKGLPVAKPIALTEGWFATGDMGTPLQDLLDHQDDEGQRERTLKDGAEALARLHKAGEWHGSGQVRDLVQTKDGIGFIDFEEDLMAVMSLAQAQARDLLLFLISTARYAKGQNNPIPQALAAYAAIAPGTVWPEIRRLSWLLGFVHRALAPWRAKLGRDARQALLAVEALKEHL